jgi:trehalose-phosphatase
MDPEEIAAVELPNLLSDADPLGFWTQLARSEQRFLGLDYDGTLAPFRVERLAAVPAPGAIQAIQALLDDHRNQIAIISGRLVEEVRQLLEPLQVLMVGSHGFERMHPDGRIERLPLRPSQRQRLDRAERQVGDLGLGDRLERKAASLAFHTRGVKEERARTLESQVAELWSDDCAGAGLSCRSFDGGVELCAKGENKGTALHSLLEPYLGSLAVYIGDDRTDEDAFRVLRVSGGVGVKVGHHELEQTAAVARLSDCEAVVEFLHRWKTTTTGTPR